MKLFIFLLFIAAARECTAQCTTRVSYGDTWIHPNGHPNQYDDGSGTVTWDGTCANDGSNSIATLSNGWKPVFNGHYGCVIGLDPSCAEANCKTRISYGSSWIPAANHPSNYDEVSGRVTWDRVCRNNGANSYAALSNGFVPTFSGNNNCQVSLLYSNCGGLYQNPVINGNCPDPGTIRDGNRYVLTCTSGGAADAFPIYTSPNLVDWTLGGHIFPSAQKPSWSKGDFWAPEIHKVGDRYIAYFTARHNDGKLSIGAGVSGSATGPFTDVGQPLVHDNDLGMIDATQFQAGNGNRYLVYKADGNAAGQHTPIYGQQLSADGTSLIGGRVQLITNDLGWEGGVVEGPWIVQRDNYYYLFYSGNGYAGSAYAVGVARSTNPLGPYEKRGDPIVKSNSVWAGPGHNSVIDTPEGNTYMVYHSWPASQIGSKRVTLVDAIVWRDGWPSVPEAPSSGSRPIP